MALTEAQLAEMCTCGHTRADHCGGEGEGRCFPDYEKTRPKCAAVCKEFVLIPVAAYPEPDPLEPVWTAREAELEAELEKLKAATETAIKRLEVMAAGRAWYVDNTGLGDVVRAQCIASRDAFIAAAEVLRDADDKTVERARIWMPIHMEGDLT